MVDLVNYLDVVRLWFRGFFRWFRFGRDSLRHRLILMIILAELTCHKIVGYFWHEGKVSLAENARLTNQVLVLCMQRGQMLANG